MNNDTFSFSFPRTRTESKMLVAIIAAHPWVDTIDDRAQALHRIRTMPLATVREAYPEAVL